MAKVTGNPVCKFFAQNVKGQAKNVGTEPT